MGGGTIGENRMGARPATTPLSRPAVGLRCRVGEYKGTKVCLAPFRGTFSAPFLWHLFCLFRESWSRDARTQQVWKCVRGTYPDRPGPWNSHVGFS